MRTGYVDSGDELAPPDMVPCVPRSAIYSVNVGPRRDFRLILAAKATAGLDRRGDKSPDRKRQDPRLRKALPLKPM